jgi:hypothetical protein
MMMTKSLRKLALTTHVTSSVGWLGAVVAYLAVASIGLTSQDAQLVRAAYLMTDLIIRFVIVPFSFAAVLTGLVQSLGTEWGLFRHHWIATKFVLTAIATVVLLVHTQTVTQMASLAAGTTLPDADFRTMRLQMVVHAAGGLLVLLAATALSVYKPWGTTRSGRNQETAEGASTAALIAYLLLALAALFVVHHLAGGMRMH